MFQLAWSMIRTLFQQDGQGVWLPAVVETACSYLLVYGSSERARGEWLMHRENVPSSGTLVALALPAESIAWIVTMHKLQGPLPVSEGVCGRLIWIPDSPDVGSDVIAEVHQRACSTRAARLQRHLFSAER